MHLLRDWKFSLVTAIALIGSILVLVNVSFHRANRTLQADVAQRQQFINQSIQLARLNNEIIRNIEENRSLWEPILRVEKGEGWCPQLPMKLESLGSIQRCPLVRRINIVHTVSFFLFA